MGGPVGGGLVTRSGDGYFGGVTRSGDGCFTGVEVEAGFFAGEAEDEDVVFLVGVEVVDVGEEVVGVAVDVEDFGFVVGVFFLEGGAFPPEGAGDDVGFGVAVDVTDGGAFGVEVGVELLAGPGDLGGGVEGDRGEDEEREECFHGEHDANAN